MKILRVSTVTVGAGRRNWLFVRIDTDVDGLTGWGEATVESHTQGVVGAVADLAPLLVGEDPTRIEHLWQVMYRQPFFTPGIVSMSALSGIDQALWDIVGKDLAVPVWRLLGGRVRDQIRAYDHLGGGVSEMVYGDTDAGEFAEAALASVANGFDAIKVLAIPRSEALGCSSEVDRSARIMAAIREAVGNDVDVMVDFHGRCTLTAAIAYIAAIADYRPFFVEEPVHPRFADSLNRIAAAFPEIPLALGERLLGRRDFCSVLDIGGLAVAQPDVSHAGGISEVRRISSACESAGVAMAPHNPLGPIATAANLQLAATTPNFLIQEVFRADVPWRDEVVCGLPQLQNGNFDIPKGPGLGIEVDLVAAASHPPIEEHHFRWFHNDGSVADW